MLEEMAFAWTFKHGQASVRRACWVAGDLGQEMACGQSLPSGRDSGI